MEKHESKCGLHDLQNLDNLHINRMCFIHLGFFLFVFRFFFFFFQCRRHGIWRFPGQGSNWSYGCRPTPQPQQHWIQAASAAYTTAHGKARPLTHEQGQGLNLCAHGYQSDSFPLYHNGSSQNMCFLTRLQGTFQ